MVWVGIACILLAGILAGGLYFSDKVLNIRVKTDDEIEELDRVSGVLEACWYASVRKSTHSIPSPFGYFLGAEWIEAAEPSHKTIIFCHGVTMSRRSSLKYARIFHGLGFHCLIYDQRRHGSSGGRFTTYGYYEKHDLQAVVCWLAERTEGSHFVGIHGESMGAAVMLQYAGMEDGADFYVADCPYAGIYAQLAYRLRVEYRLPPFPLLPLVRWIIMGRAGFDLKAVSPLSVISRIRHPVLFIHGEHDRYIPSCASLQLYQAKAGPKEMHIFPEAGHGKSLASNPQAYGEITAAFVQSIVP